MRIIILLLLIILPVQSRGESCDSCAVKGYSERDLYGIETDSIRIMRNEIFARHNYAFKDKALVSHFSQYEWYAPKSKNVTLNEIETSNVQLFKRVEMERKREWDSFAHELPYFIETISVASIKHYSEAMAACLKEEQEDLLSEILELFAESPITLNSDSDEFDIVQKENGNVLRYSIRVFGRDVHISRNSYCDNSGVDECGEFSEIFQFRYDSDSLKFVRFDIAG